MVIEIGKEEAAVVERLPFEEEVEESIEDEAMDEEADQAGVDEVPVPATTITFRIITTDRAAARISRRCSRRATMGIWYVTSLHQCPSGL